VRREAATFGIEKYQRRMDVLVEAGARLAIENKVDSGEQREQIADYLRHLHRCAAGNAYALIYLTPNGRLPESLDLDTRTSAHLYCWSYQIELLDWLKECARHCEARKVKVFLTDFIRYIETRLKRGAAHAEDRNEQ